MVNFHNPEEIDEGKFVEPPIVKLPKLKESKIPPLLITTIKTDPCKPAEELS